MSIESVVDRANPTIQAFTGYESSVFLSWLEAVGDIMLNDGQPSAKETMANLGGMVLALSAAALELQERELAERKED